MPSPSLPRRTAAVTTLACVIAGAPLALAPAAIAADAHPVFATHPQDTAVQAGEQATLTATFQPGVSTFSPQWFQDTTDNGVQDGTAVSGATAATYTFTPDVAEDGVAYYLRVYATPGGSFGTFFSDSARVSVGDDPVALVTAPADTAVQAHQRARFAVVVTGTTPISYQWQRATGESWADIDGATGASYSLKTTPEDDGARLRVVVGNPHGEPVTTPAATLTVRAPSGSLDPVDDASLAWSLNTIYQGGNPAGTGCSFYSADLGTDFVAEKDDVRIVHADADGRFVNVTDGNKCLPDNGQSTSPLDQLMLFSGGEGSANPVTGEATVSWDGTVTLNAYGGLLPWHLSDPTLTVAADGTGTLTATTGGLGASWENPDDTAPVPDRRVTVATFGEVELTDGGITVTPDYAGVDYFPLTEGGTRSAESAIPASVKAANKAWGSWPESFVDFQYETGLSSYWHTSGLSADPDKGPHPFQVWYDEAPAVAELPAIVANPAVDGRLPLINGRRAVVSADVDGADAVQWQRQVSGTWTDVDGATGETLVVDPVASSWHNASLRLRATNASGARATAAYRITTADYVAPAFTRQPVDTTVIAETPVSIGFATTGTPAIDAASVVLEQEDGESWTTVATDSATASAVEVASVPEDWDGARFRVVAASLDGEQTVSSPFTLDVHPNLGRPQVVVVSQASIDPAAATTLTLLGAGFAVPDRETATASYSLDVGLFATADRPSTGGDPRSRWIATSSGSSGGQLYQGSMQSSGGTFRLTMNVPANRLDAAASYGVGTFLRLTDSATWTDSYDNRSGDSWTPVAVGDQVAPSVTTAPADVTMTAPSGTGSAAFEVAVAGSPEPTVAWQTRRAGGPWQDAEATGARVELPVTADDHGLRVRAVATGAGVAVSDVATVTLTERATTIALTASASRQVYAAPASRRVRLVATVGDGGTDGAAVGSGSVRFTAGARTLGVVGVTGGRAELVLDRTLSVGAHRAVATYLPEDGSLLAGSTSTAAAVAVVRTPATLRSRVERTGTGRQRALVVHLRATATGVTPSGAVTVELRRPRTSGWVTRVVRLRDGAATLRLSARAAGAYRVRAHLAAGPVTTADQVPVKVRRLR